MAAQPLLNFLINACDSKRALAGALRHAARAREARHASCDVARDVTRDAAALGGAQVSTRRRWR